MITAIKLAEELLTIRSYSKILFDQYVYREDQLINLLQNLGFPEPDFEGYGKQCERLLLSCPGDTIKETLMHRNITKAEFTRKLQGPLSLNGDIWNLRTVNELLSGELKIDESIAKDLERVLAIPKDFWLNREKLYREKLEGLK